MKQQKKKNGFTIVELVIVIAVIAILAGVLIPTFSGVVKKANVSNDLQMIKNLNTTLKTNETIDGKPANMYVALSYAAAGGYTTDKIEAKASDNLILWDSVNNYFCYLNNGEMEYPGADDDINMPSSDRYWALVDTIDPECEYSQYLRSTTLTGDVVVKKAGFDAGNNTSLTKVIVNNTTNNSITVRTNGGALVINAPNADVYVSGTANTVTINDAAPSSVHIADAFIKELIVNDADGHVEVESGTVISRLIANNGDIDIESGSTIAYLEANAGDISVAEAGCVTQYYAASDNLVSGSAGTKVNTKVAEAQSCAKHTETTKEVGGNKVTYCSVCGDIISVERIGGGATTSGGDSGSGSGDSGSGSGSGTQLTVTITGASSTLEVDNYMQLDAIVSPEQSATFIWTSSNTSVATVNEIGTVYGVADGTVVIQVAVANSEAYATVNITVGTGGSGGGSGEEEQGGGSGGTTSDGKIIITDLNNYTIQRGSGSSSIKQYILSDDYNTTLTSALEISITGGFVTLDLNEKTVIYNPGSYDADDACIKILGEGNDPIKKVTIKNGTIVSKYNGIYVNWCELTLENCTVIANADLSDANHLTGNTNTTDKKLYAVQSDITSTITINGGSYHVNKTSGHIANVSVADPVGCFAIYVNSSDNTISTTDVIINSGTVDGDILLQGKTSDEAATITVNGGTYSNCTVYVGYSTYGSNANTFKVGSTTYGKTSGPSKYTISGSSNYTVTEVTQ